MDIPLPFFCHFIFKKYLQNGVDRPSKPVHNCQRWFRYRSLSDPQRVRTLNLYPKPVSRLVFHFFKSHIPYTNQLISAYHLNWGKWRRNSVQWLLNIFATFSNVMMFFKVPLLVAVIYFWGLCMYIDIFYQLWYKSKLKCVL